MPTITSAIDYKIVATKTGKILRKPGRQIFDHVVMKEIEFPRLFFKQLRATGIGAAHQAFVAELRLMHTLRHSLGKTKWHVECLTDEEKLPLFCDEAQARSMRFKSHAALLDQQALMIEGLNSRMTQLQEKYGDVLDTTVRQPAGLTADDAAQVVRAAALLQAE